ncbi:MAG TPA: hypothetical protein DCS17_03060 [Flavobacterium sp.]|nr:hypothetical protein [Flavobacterium sp.]
MITYYFVKPKISLPNIFTIQWECKEILARHPKLGLKYKVLKKTNTFKGFNFLKGLLIYFS